MANTFIRKPWLHFVVIGALLYAGQTFFSAPEVDVIEPPSAQKIAEMRGLWLRTTGRPITPQQLQQLINDTIEREMLYREAIKRQWHLHDPVVRERLVRDMRFLDPDSTKDDRRLFKQAIQSSLHENDLVVRRRLIQMMELSAFATVRDQQPKEAVLQSLFEARSEQFMKPSTVAFEHIFISRDKHPAPLDRAEQLLANLTKDQQVCRDNAKALAESDAFLHGLQFQTLSSRQAERYFGAAFVEQLMAVAAQQQVDSPRWLGPLSSSYGQHLVCINNYQPPQPQTFADVRHLLLADWQRQQQQNALRELIKQLRERYEVGS